MKKNITKKGIITLTLSTMALASILAVGGMATSALGTTGGSIKGERLALAETSTLALADAKDTRLADAKLITTKLAIADNSLEYWIIDGRIHKLADAKLASEKLAEKKLAETSRPDLEYWIVKR